MNAQPMEHIETERLHLRTVTEADAAIVRLINGDEFQTDEAAMDYIRWMKNPGRLLIIFYIRLRLTEQCIGRVYIHAKPEINDEVEIGYSVLEEYRNQGYATEAAAAVVKFAFEQAGQEVLCAIVKPENIASRRVIEKLGFKTRDICIAPDENNQNCEFDCFQLHRDSLEELL
ncbi:MAG: GNAT family N-acetyltransferase [Oscillospiraceae bacterium]|nr:GNAT family N-acetyltransferase [Oscillospiraceae bacterium]